MYAMRKWMITLLILIVVATIGYNYIYKDHRDIESETAKFEISTDNLSSAFLSNQNKAEAEYLNETIIVFGTITELTTHSITLDDKVFCQFTNAIQDDLKTHTKIKIKGRVIGFDDLLEQVKLDQSTIN